MVDVRVLADVGLLLVISKATPADGHEHAIALQVDITKEASTKWDWLRRTRSPSPEAEADPIVAADDIDLDTLWLESMQLSVAAAQTLRDLFSSPAVTVVTTRGCVQFFGVDREKHTLMSSMLIDPRHDAALITEAMALANNEEASTATFQLYSRPLGAEATRNIRAVLREVTAN